MCAVPTRASASAPVYQCSGYGNSLASAVESQFAWNGSANVMTPHNANVSVYRWCYNGGSGTTFNYYDSWYGYDTDVFNGSHPAWPWPDGDYTLYGASYGMSTIYSYTYFRMSGGNLTFPYAYTPPVDTSTRFISTTPLNEEVVSSTTPVTVGAHLFINPSDYQDGMYLNVAFTNQTVQFQGGSALDAWNSAWGTGSTGGFGAIKIPLVSGDNDVSTTTSNFVRDGRVTASWSVQTPTFWSSLWWIGDLFSGNTSLATTTTFIVGEKTMTDIGWDNGGAGLANGILFGTTTSGIATSTFEACYPSAFNLVGCAKGLIIPSPQAISLVLAQAKDGFLSYFPFGYVSRFYNIISGTATTTLPNLSITVPAGFPASGDTLNLTMWGKLMGPGSYLSTATSTVTGHTFYGTFESYWEKFVYFVFGLGVALRLLGMNSVVSFGLGSKDKNAQKIQSKKK